MDKVAIGAIVPDIWLMSTVRIVYLLYFKA
jgi:hypothetical protein